MSSGIGPVSWQSGLCRCLLSTKAKSRANKQQQDTKTQGQINIMYSHYSSPRIFLITQKTWLLLAYRGVCTTAQAARKWHVVGCGCLLIKSLYQSERLPKAHSCWRSGHVLVSPLSGHLNQPNKAFFLISHFYKTDKQEVFCQCVCIMQINN